ncbi:MAG: hypothetical protein J6S69_09530 [Proteobacteria bacterium]|nr:hypothetical protein [Pseudomonadota bacterium]
MNKRFLFSLLGALTVLAGCSDDSVPGVSLKTPCETEGATSCSAIGELLVCTNGFFEPQACAENERCRVETDGATCAEACIPEQFPISCSGEEGIRTCDSNGFVKVEPCETGNICHDAMCIDESRTTCDNTYLTQCRDDEIVTECKNGWVVSHLCEEGKVCNNGLCVLPESCDSTTHILSCADQNTIRACQNDLIVNIKCGEDKFCDNGECVKDTACNEKTFTLVCTSENAVETCVYEHKTVTNCNAGEICENGVCQSLDEPCTEEGAVTCDSANITKTCKDGVWHKSYCNVGTEVCIDGVCSDKSTATVCIENSYAPRCDVNATLTCEFGYVVKRECTANQHCDAGICYDNIQEGDVCDETTFVQQCFDDGFVAVCVNGTVTKVTCGEQRCQAGACVNKACNTTTFTPECRGHFEVTACVDHAVTKVNCEPNTHCVDGTCIPDANPGDPCNPETFTTTCSSEGKVLSCETQDGVSTIVATECTGNKAVCFNGACVACNPNTYTQTCTPSESSTTGPLKTSCNPDGTLNPELCPIGSVCLGTECAQCNPATSKPGCLNATTAQLCKADGSFENKACNAGEQCLEGTGCTTACDSNGQCAADHYVCVAGLCVFQPECTTSSTPICHDEKSHKICQAPGIYSTPTPCKSNEKCENGVCVGNECDSNTYGTQCDGKSPTTCVNGYIVKNTACSGNTPYCVDGTCKACKHGETAIQCSGNTAIICAPNHTLTTQACANNEVCKPVEGCVSKCPGFTGDSCNADGNRVYCADNGSTAIEVCDFTETCIAGTCTDRTGNVCNREIYQNTCHATPYGSALEYCHPTLGVQFRTCTTSGSSTNFCGTINGETDCFQRCTAAETNPICGYFNQDLLENNYAMGVCTAGTDHTGNQAYGYLPKLGVCREYGDSTILYSSSCYHTGSTVEFKTFVCESMGRGTCDATSGACTGAVECNDTDTRCDGLTAKSCEYDPALQKNVLLSMDCSNLGDKACVTYTVKGNKRAVCKGTETYNNVTPAYSVSSLGTCNADGKNANILHTLHYLSSNHFGFYSTGCAAGCETKTENGITFSYCK